MTKNHWQIEVAIIYDKQPVENITLPYLVSLLQY